MNIAKKTAFLSVSNKEGIVDFAKELVALGWDIMSSTGTAKVLKENGVPVTDLADRVGKPILGHRVVTLSREFHAALLARPIPEDEAELAALNMPRIDLLCCDFYPLEKEIAKADATPESVIENTDIGGPTMIRSAAKGRRIVVCDANDRQKVIEWLKNGEQDAAAFITMLAAKAEYTVSKYAFASGAYHAKGTYAAIFGEKVASCKYGENAWQTPAGLYAEKNTDPLSLDKFELVEGTEPSYNNFCDLDRMLQSITHMAAGFERNFKSVPKLGIAVKHGNACGAAYGENAEEVIKKVTEGDLQAIFGGSFMANFEIGASEATVLREWRMGEGAGKRLLDTIIAPSFTNEAIEILARKGGKCRLLKNKDLAMLGEKSLDTATRVRYVRGGFLQQPNYTFVIDFSDSQFSANGATVSDAIKKDIILAWAIGSTSTSNTISIVKNNRLYGNGVGQQDRVGAALLAISRAKNAATLLGEGELDLSGAVAYSDSFFPFPDGPETLINAGVTTILSTSGSRNDEMIIKLCQEKGATLMMLPDAVARGFYGH